MATTEGINIYRLHKYEGYKFAETLGDLTPLQELFLIYASQHDAKLQERQYKYGQEKLEMDNEILEKLKQRGFKK